jgi:hypothetical protein
MFVIFRHLRESNHMTAIGLFRLGTKNTQADPQPDLLFRGNTTAASQALTFDTAILTNTTKRMRMTVTGRVTGGTGTVGHTYVTTQELAAKNVAGVVSQVGGTTVVSTFTDAGMTTTTVAYSASGTNLRTTITSPNAGGEGANPNIDWTLLVETDDI